MHPTGMSRTMNKLKILIIDDDKLQANVLKSLLIDENESDIECIYSGRCALQRIGNDVFDLIFCDLQMPKMDGVELLTLINQSSFNGGVVIASALDLSLISIVSDLCNALQFSFIDGLEKPLKRQQIKSIIEDAYEIKKGNSKCKPIDNINISIGEIISSLECGEFTNHYQPQVDFKTEEIVSIEALVRLNHVEHGLLSPYYFLPQIEKSGLLDKLFNVVFDNVISDYLSGKLKYKTSINITYDSLSKPGFANDFIRKCKYHSLDTSLFTLELTEGDAYNSSIHLLENISRLRVNKVGVSIDDFGTGHSSLDKLSRLPFTEMKLDRSFITHCLNNKFNDIIIKFSLELSKELNIPIVAEGVENKETWTYLKNIGFDICQGYYSGKPMPIELLNNYKKRMY